MDATEHVKGVSVNISTKYVLFTTVHLSAANRNLALNKKEDQSPIGWRGYCTVHVQSTSGFFCNHTFSKESIRRVARRDLNWHVRIKAQCQKKQQVVRRSRKRWEGYKCCKKEPLSPQIGSLSLILLLSRNPFLSSFDKCCRNLFLSLPLSRPAFQFEL